MVVLFAGTGMSNADGGSSCASSSEVPKPSRQPIGGPAWRGGIAATDLLESGHGSAGLLDHTHLCLIHARHAREYGRLIKASIKKIVRK